MSHDIYENKIKIWAIKKNVQVKNAWLPTAVWGVLGLPATHYHLDAIDLKAKLERKKLITNQIDTYIVYICTTYAP